MKKIILLLLLVSGFVNAQECDFKINEFDAFTKLKKTETKRQVVAVTTSTGIYFSFFKNNYTYLKVGYHTSGIKSIVVGTDNKISLMLLDDSLIELSPLEIYMGEFNSLNDTDITVKYIITIDDIKKIRSVGIKKIRFNSTKYYYDFDVKKEKWIEKLNNNIDCFIKETN